MDWKLRLGTMALALLLGAPPAQAVQTVAERQAREVQALQRARLADTAERSALTQTRARIELAQLAERSALTHARARIELAQLAERSAVALEAPPAWAPQDPADSLWRAARGALNEGQYRRAATTFGTIISRHPRSEYAPSAHYYQALALSQLGDPASLRQARELLEVRSRHQGRTAQQVRETEALMAQIDARLQRRGDADAALRNAERVAELRHAEAARTEARQAGRAQRADCEEDEVRMIALQAVMRSNPEGALPVLREILARTDACAADLQGFAFMLLGQSDNAEARRILTESARNARTPEAQASALMFMTQRSDPAATALALELLRTSTDEDVQGAALMALQRTRTPEARQALRDFARRSGGDEDLRAMAIMAFGHSGNAEDRQFLRQLYPTVQEEDLKGAILMAFVRDDVSAQDVEWLMNIAMDEGEEEDVRMMALMHAGRSERVSVEQLARIYEGAGEEDIRQHVVMVLAQRLPQRAALDQLVTIVRDPRTDVDVRRHVIVMLSQSDDPEVQRVLLEIIRR